jgi:dsDNA-specific endonuclease/ATPase MutS2
MLIGYIPGKEDIDAYVNKLKQEGKEQLKQVEASASKILQEVEKARKEGKGQADAFLKGLKQGASYRPQSYGQEADTPAAAPADVDSLVQQLKEAAKKAG